LSVGKALRLRPTIHDSDYAALLVDFDFHGGAATSSCCPLRLYSWHPSDVRCLLKVTSWRAGSFFLSLFR